MYKPNQKRMKARSEGRNCGCHCCCAPCLFIGSRIVRSALVMGLIQILTLFVYIKSETVYGIDMTNRSRGSVKRNLQNNMKQNIFIRTPNDMIQDDAQASKSQPKAKTGGDVFAVVQVANNKVGKKNSGSKCKSQKGKMKKSDKYTTVNDDGINDDDTICSTTHPPTITPSLSSSITVAPTFFTTTTFPPTFISTTITTFPPTFISPTTSPPTFISTTTSPPTFISTTTSHPTFFSTSTATPLPAVQPVTNFPSAYGKGKNMNKSKSKTRTTSSPAPVISTNRPSMVGKSKGKMSPTFPPQAQIPVYNRCNENKSPDTTAPIPTPIIPMVPITSTPVLVPVLTLGPIVPPFSTTLAPIIPPTIATIAPVATITSAPLVPPTLTAAPVLPPVPAPTLRRFELTLDFDEATVPTADQPDFIAAAQRWEQVIIGDVEDVPIQELAGFPPDVAGCQYPTDTGVVDDLYMCIFYETIPGDVIGQGGYILTRDNGIPVSGFARIDPDAIADAREFGYFNALLLHEFGHAIGIGTAGACPGDSASSMANIEYQRVSQCTTPIPIDRPGCGHYSEECLVSELMTPIVEIGDNPLSRITVGWADDIGYEVDYGAADPFDSSQLGTAAGCNCNRRLSTATDVVSSYHNKVRYLGQQASTMNHTTVSNRATQQQQQPKLSTEGYKIALESGLTYLYEQIVKRNSMMGRDDDQQQANQTPENVTFGTGTKLTYVGDRFVWVYIRENDRIFSVLVQP